SVEIIKKYRPNALVSWNHAGDFWDWLGDHQDLKEYVDYYSNEAHYLQANTRHTQYYKQSFTAKHLQNHGKPFQGHTPGHSSWHTFIMKPVNWLRLESAVSLAHGGSATIGVNVLPDGKVEPEEIKRLKPLFAQIKEKEGYVRDAEPVKDVAVLYSMSSAFAEGVRKDSPGFAQSGPRGFHMALVDGHQQFIILNEMDITELQDYRLIIIPQQINLKESLISQLTAYIKGGGNLLLTYETSLFNRKGKIRKNFALSEVMGIDFINYSPYSANYAELNREMERGIVTYPLLFEKKAIQVNLKEAKPLGKIVYPEAERTEEKYYWPPYNYNPPYKKSDYPIITLNRYGKGKCIYIAVPIGEEVGETNNSWLKQLILNMVDNLLPEQLIETDAPAGVEIVLNRQKERKRYILHLINHYVVTGGKISLTDEKPILGPININLNLNRIGKINRVYSLEKNINWRIDKSWLRINISSMKTHSMVVIK
ncbi:MAG: beta-galactosidase trimerization domain-containing protein, partial [Candidatus Omnitrophica bacterium]|nr:beta-galactosidase trimerization domain-containing protein [Candidatus Omnitrophota bacterium]